MSFLQKILAAYTVTPEMTRVAWDVGAIGTVYMKPEHFLVLTRGSDPTTLKDIKHSAKPFEQYEQYGTSGEIRVMPMLEFNRALKVNGHEGRHRAFAALKAGHKQIEVMLVPNPKLYVEERAKYPYPQKLWAQFRSGVQVDMKPYEHTFKRLKPAYEIKKSKWE